MTEQSDILVALPGGIGTLDEIFHVMAAASIGYHRKKVIFYNEYGFYDELLKTLKTLEDKGFARQPFSTYYEIANTPEELKEKINSYMIDSIKQLLQQEAQAVLNIPVTDAYEKAVQLIVEQVHQEKRELVTPAVGKSRTNCDEHCYLLSVPTGTFPFRFPFVPYPTYVRRDNGTVRYGLRYRYVERNGNGNGYRLRFNF